MPAAIGGPLGDSQHDHDLGPLRCITNSMEMPALDRNRLLQIQRMYLLLISGIGILKVASWGRTLSVSSAALGIICYGADLFLSGPGLFTAFLIYCVVLMVMFFTPGWRAAFSSEAAGATPTASESDQSRAAA